MTSIDQTPLDLIDQEKAVKYRNTKTEGN